ncbi:hypothetical protein [Furfurilactobacillus curtus]|uniref:ABC transporter permease n=1 Tax=Furfurilactobacillus curtus TaxID=1746200 RepID=A0ABQ5JPJ8_9LACO
MKENQRQQLYTDAYFERGHWGLKICQTLVAVLGWLIVLSPLVLMVISAISFYQPTWWPWWHLQLAQREMLYYAVVLGFIFVLVGIFTVSMTLIQNRKRQQLVEQWPTFDPLNQQRRKVELNAFMTKRFGSLEARHAVRQYTVKPEQNLATDQIQQLFHQQHLGK